MNIYNYTKNSLDRTVILCQHGWNGSGQTMQNLFGNLKKLNLTSGLNYYFCDDTLYSKQLEPLISDMKSSSTTTAVLREKCEAVPALDYLMTIFGTKFESRFSNVQPDNHANVFISTEFVDPSLGLISDQVVELSNMINIVKRIVAPDVKIVLIGHSKGGVVNCQYAIENEGAVEKIINIATPHTSTVIRNLLHIVGYYYTRNHPTIKLLAPFQRKCVEALANVQSDIIESLLHNHIIKRDLCTNWNKMGIRPKFTPIAGKAIVFNETVQTDGVVPVASAIADGFKGRTFNDIINHFIVSDKTTAVLNTPAMEDFLEKNAEELLQYIEGLFDDHFNLLPNPVSTFISVLLENMIKTVFGLSNCGALFHCKLFNIENYILTQPTIGKRVLAGLTA